VKIVELGGQLVDIVLVCNCELRVASIVVIAGEVRADAKVLVAPRAESAYSAGSTEPGNSDTGSDIESRCGLAASNNRSHDLVPGNDVVSVHRKVSLDDVEVGPAHTAGTDLDEHLTGAGNRRFSVREPNGIALEGAGGRDLPRLHESHPHRSLESLELLRIGD
jgi:hypothetical protein